tara:strand:+ start:33883 stop:34011 length:129 start_codon:yes stop_codon:yes gene_type:complete
MKKLKNREYIGYWETISLSVINEIVAININENEIILCEISSN